MEGNFGERLLPQVIADIARTTPNRTFAFVARSRHLNDGLLDVKYSQFSSAVDRCAWWLEELLGRSHTFETVTYLGSVGLLYPVLLLAAIKTGHKVGYALRMRTSDGLTIDSGAVHCTRNYS